MTPEEAANYLEQLLDAMRRRVDPHPELIRAIPYALEVAIEVMRKSQMQHEIPTTVPEPDPKQVREALERRKKIEDALRGL
jgi:hypothetical protein